MPQWFKVKYAYKQLIDDSKVGTRNQEFIKQKTIKETLLIDAVSFTDAEARCFNHLPSNLPDVDITNIDRKKYADVFQHETGETWFEVKTDFLTENEKTGKLKRLKSVILVNATSNVQAHERVNESLKTSLNPYEITHVDKTDILDIVEYTA